MPRVIDIQRRHMELGRIRLGEKGDRGQPMRLDTWRLTSASRALLESAAAVYGGTVEEWTDAPDKGYYQLTTETTTLDVMVPPGDAFSQYYEQWSGGGCKRRCDGVTELLTGSPCKCDADDRDCKITTRINVMLPQVAGLGVWRLESHGYYAAAELPDMLELLQQVSGGRLVAGVLRIEQRSSKKHGKTTRFPVPVLDLPNVTLASLTGGQVIVNPPAQLESGKPALYGGTTGLPADPAFDNDSPGFGERPALPSAEPEYQPERGEQVAAAGRRAGAPPAAPSPAQYRRGELAELLREKNMHIAQLERFADLVGIPKGSRATNIQMDDLIDAVRGHGITQPEPVRAHAGSGVGPATVGRGGDGSSDLPAALDTPHAAGTAAATVSAELGTQPAPATNLMERILAVTGGEEVPAKPGTPEYVALPAPAKASARAYWQRQSEPEPVEQLQVPV